MKRRTTALVAALILLMSFALVAHAATAWVVRDTGDVHDTLIYNPIAFGCSGGNDANNVQLGWDPRFDLFDDQSGTVRFYAAESHLNGTLTGRTYAVTRTVSGGSLITQTVPYARIGYAYANPASMSAGLGATFSTRCV